MARKKAELAAAPGQAPAPIKKKKKWLRWVILILVIVVGIGIGFRALKKKVQNMLGRYASGVTEYTVERMDLASTISGTGNLSYASTSSISIPQGIEIGEVMVSVGDTVTKGQVLATVNQASAAGALYDLNNSIEELEETIEDLPREADDPDSNEHLHKVQLEAQLDGLKEDRDALREIYETGVITATTDGVMETVNIASNTKAGDEIAGFSGGSSLQDIYSMLGMSADPTQPPAVSGLVAAAPADSDMTAAPAVSNLVARPVQGNQIMLTSAGEEDPGEGGESGGGSDEGGSGDSGSDEGGSGDGGSDEGGSGDGGSDEGGSGDGGSDEGGSGDGGSDEGGSGDGGSDEGGSDEGGSDDGKDPDPGDQTKVTLITQKQLSKLTVTAPAAGAAPQTSISATASYTGNIAWNALDTFEAGRTYTATILLFAKDGYAFGPASSYKLSLPGATLAAGTPRVIGGNGVNGNAMLILATYQTEGSGDNPIPQIDINEILKRYGLTGEQLAALLQQAIQRQLGTLPQVDISSYLSGLNGLNSLGGLGGLGGLGDLSGLGGDTGLSNISSNQMVAFSIASGDEMIVTMQISELDVNSVEVGQTAEVTLDAITEETYSGEITNIRTYSNDGSVTYVAEVTLNRAEGMRSGMSASAEVVIAEKKNVLVVPVDALQEDGDIDFVYTSYYTDKNGQVQLDGRVEITCGLSDGEKAEVTEGLSEGDIVCYKPSSDIWSNLEAIYGGGSEEEA